MVHRFKERVIAAEHGVVDDPREVADRLMGMDAQEKGGAVGHSVSFRVGAAHGTTGLRSAAAVADGLVEILRGGDSHQGIEFAEVEAIQTVEITDGIGRVVIAEPPEPVGALAAAELFEDFGLLVRGECADMPIHILFSRAEQVPGATEAGGAMRRTHTEGY